MNQRLTFNFRCNMCNKVSHPEVSSLCGEHFPGKFYKDPEGFGHLCADCFSESYLQEDDFPPLSEDEETSFDLDDSDE